MEHMHQELERPIVATLVIDSTATWARMRGYDNFLPGLEPQAAITRLEFRDIGKAYERGKLYRNAGCSVLYEFTPHGEDQAEVLFGVKPCWSEA